MIKVTPRTRYGCLLAAGGVAAALYLNSLWGEFVFDDHEAIENNPDVRYDELKLPNKCSCRDIHTWCHVLGHTGLISCSIY
jgi:hypothetical protein